ncbi:subtilase cytotoxin subunit B [Salmonella enterica subsp. enterica serovar Johannesburg]|uniref:Subtilase cytotoxin subunit B n=3 Tax=Salmonella enterica TaxID=28901 RepID=A0A5T3C1L6_SALER|nr:typhoid-like toxin S-CDT binding subunit PltB [Salmonella enterica]EAA7331727.1 subtilase cytotoxin subunit B [Salmonella enterica subsp. enterica]ECH7856353.1 subtilase cytotoxin subunit B [Salmonella enterica subsp. enterica serovar Brandenburg]ECH8768827.1 subtilase cytotoxin subunit B [Salmonella enterica subsp. enterica serovar Hvittingfoss]EDI1784878.1 subtilase cytotoxin subunit B [Salmonella enterica subsp. enterica serovar Dublin]EDK6101227.1 subtilase cytotoxin subunit B [Salmonel
MYINKFVPVYTLLILIYSFNASAEWTGDKTNAYYSDEVISELHVGQIDTGPYFCIKTVKANGCGIPVVACAVSKQSIWAPSFKELLDQARYFYSTGQSVRIHVQKNIWTYPLFVNTFSANALVGLSSCSATQCFGPK